MAEGRRIIRRTEDSSMDNLAAQALAIVQNDPIVEETPVQETPQIVETYIPKYEPARDENFLSPDLPKTAIEEKLDIVGEELVNYIATNVKYMDDKLRFNGATPPTPYEIDMALATYEQTLFSITAMYEQARFDAERAKAIYDEWYYGKYMEVRNTYNTKDVKNASWLSAKEIDATVFTVYKKEAAELKSQVIKADGERSTMERLLKSWENYQYILANLKKSVIAQLGASNLTVDLRRGDEIDL